MEPYTEKTFDGFDDLPELPEKRDRSNDLLSSISRNELIEKITELQKANALLVQWKGEIDSYRIALSLPFPDDYDRSPKYALYSLIQAVKDENR